MQILIDQTAMVKGAQGRVAIILGINELAANVLAETFNTDKPSPNNTI